MSKHRDLAQLVYAKILGRESASRIWRTVVVAGAMLASPMTASAGGQAKPAPPAQANAPAGAPMRPPEPPPPPAPTKADLAKQAHDALTALETENTALAKTIIATTAEVKNAKSDAERQAAQAKLKDQQAKKAELKPKITAAKAEAKKADAAAKAEANANKPKPRPRTPEEIRPRGRGFILS